MSEHPHPDASTLVVVPTYNEASGISTLLDLILEQGPFHVLVVDDGSPDGTGDIVRARSEADDRIQLLSRPTKQGLGTAYIAGFRQGLEAGYARFVEMDADLSHDAADLPRLVRATSGRDSADLAIGSRYVRGGGIEGWSRGRHLLSYTANTYARLMLGIDLRDSTSGFRCYRREVIEALDLEALSSEGYAFQVEMAFLALLAGFRVTEIPITFRERSGGRSKMSRQIVVEGVVWVTRTGLLRLRR